MRVAEISAPSTASFRGQTVPDPSQCVPRPMGRRRNSIRRLSRPTNMTTCRRRARCGRPLCMRHRARPLSPRRRCRVRGLPMLSLIRRRRRRPPRSSRLRRPRRRTAAQKHRRPRLNGLDADQRMSGLRCASLFCLQNESAPEIRGAPFSSTERLTQPSSRSRSRCHSLGRSLGHSRSESSAASWPRESRVRGRRAGDRSPARRP